MRSSCGYFAVGKIRRGVWVKIAGHLGLVSSKGAVSPWNAPKGLQKLGEIVSAWGLLRAHPMNCMEPIAPPELECAGECLIEMPLGLLGFERFNRFTLAAHPEEEPFLWLQAVGEPNLSFLVLSPFAVAPTYQPEIAEEDAAFLELQGPEDTLIIAIVTVRNSQQATINLKGPIVLNRRTLRAKQVIPVNGSNFPVDHPLPVQSA